MFEIPRFFEETVLGACSFERATPIPHLLAVRTRRCAPFFAGTEYRVSTEVPTFKNRPGAASDFPKVIVCRSFVEGIALAYRSEDRLVAASPSTRRSL